MGAEDFGDEYEMRPIEQDEEFFGSEFNDMLISFPREEVEKVTCYYKLRGILPSEPEYAARCPDCDGFPVRDGCVRYVTRDHIEGFPKRFGFSNTPEQTVPTGLDDLDQQFPHKTLDDIGSWRGPSTFGT